MALNKASAEQILAAARTELERIHKRLVAIRIRLYRESGNYPDELAAAIARVDFLLRDLMAGVVTPFDMKPAAAAKREPVRILPADADVSDFEILHALSVDGHDAFTGENGQYCRRPALPNRPVTGLERDPPPFYLRETLTVSDSGCAFG